MEAAHSSETSEQKIMATVRFLERQNYYRFLHH
jgi:hypothetical protein